MRKISVMAAAVAILVARVPCLPARNLELSYSTYLGGGDTDYLGDMAVDPGATVFLTGYTYSLDFPTDNAGQPSSAGPYDVFITRLGSSGSSLIYSTYLGGIWDDYAFGIEAAPDGRAYITGETYSSNFPTVNPYQSTPEGDSDAFICIISEFGDSILYSTYLGGGGEDGGYGIVIDSNECFYVTGRTGSADFPTRDSYQGSWAGGTFDAFVTKFASSGTGLVYSTYLGGTSVDGQLPTGWKWFYAGQAGIALDSNNMAYVTGTTESFDFPTRNPYQASNAGDGDAFVTKLSSSGSALDYSTFLGGDEYNWLPAGECGTAITVDQTGCAYICGATASLNFPTRNPYQAAANGAIDWEGFLTKLSSSGSSIDYSSYLGGAGDDYCYGIDLDIDKNAFLTGYTQSADFPTISAYQASFSGIADAFVTGFASSGSALEYSTYLGGSGEDRGIGIATHPSGVVYVAGWTESTDDFPVKDAYQATPAGGNDVFCSKLIMEEEVPAPQWIYDYNGDGTSDIAIFRDSTGLWAIRGLSRIYFGGSADQPAPGDYNGDGTTEVGIFRGSSGLWALRGVSRVYWGNAFDIPQPGDYDGDGSWDIGIFRTSTGLWAIRDVTRLYFGTGSEVPAPGYYNGDDAMDIGIFRDSTGLWAIRDVSRVYFGGTADFVCSGDYNDDGLFEIGIFRQSSGLWAIRGVTRRYFGGSTDLPVPADYSGDGRDTIGIFRQSSGLWAAVGVTRVYFGSAADIPVTR